MRQEHLRDERQNEHFDDRKDHDQRDTSTGTTGRARMAPPTAIAAETPQIEMPEASGAAHSRLKPNHLRATKYTTAQ